MSRSVLVTGASGFIGAPLVRALVREGWQVRAAARDPVPDGSHHAAASGLPASSNHSCMIRTALPWSVITAVKAVVLPA